jgi:hypothetical protein
MRAAWTEWGTTALAATLALLLGGPLWAADESGVHYVAEELGSRTKTADASTGAPKSGLSDSAVRVMSTYALSILPDEYPLKNGEMVKLDKSDPNIYLIPTDDARRVIKVATRSAYAEVCDLPELEKTNFDAMIQGEEARKTWSPQQLMFIHALHTFATSYLSGNATITESPADGSAAANAGDGSTTTITPKKLDCPPGQKEKVAAAINAYVQSANAANAQMPAPPAPAASGAN